MKRVGTLTWGVILCSPVELQGRFGGTYCIHLQSRRVSEASSRRPLPLSCLHLDSEDGSSKFFRNVSELPYYTTLHPRRHSHRRENIISNTESTP
jgi:hypothetical protein